MPIFISKKKLESEIAKRTSEACDQIASEMGAEIHDDLIQKLSIFRLYIDRIERSSTDPVEIQSLVVKMRRDFEQVVLAIKSISKRLLPIYIEGYDLHLSLELLCQNMEYAGTGHIHVESQGIPIELTDNVKTHIVRIVQELIQNAFRHSAAWHIWVRLHWFAHELIIEVEDDGSGFGKIPEFIDRLKKKSNTLKMRALTIGASIDYIQGAKGLLARFKLSITNA
jgi:two-component system NarL family sensor kinase